MPTKKKKVTLDKAELLIQEGIKKWENEFAEKARTLYEKLSDISATLYPKGITGVKLHYRGEDDSGDFEFTETLRTFGSYQIPDEMEDTLREIAWFFVPSGFEINDGGLGVVTFDFVKKTIVVEHSERVIDYTSSTKNFSFKDVVSRVKRDND